MILYCPNCVNKDSEEEDFAIESEVVENLQLMGYCHICKNRYFIKLYKVDEVKIPSMECEAEESFNRLDEKYKEPKSKNKGYIYLPYIPIVKVVNMNDTKKVS